MDGEIAMVIMLYRTNILALVGSDNNINYNRSKVIIWDDHQKKSLSELRFNQNVMNVKLRKDKIIVVCRDKIYLFNLGSFQNMDIIETGDNTHGIVGVSYEQNQTILAYPDKQKGNVRVKNYEKNSVFSINAHENNIAYIAMSYDGNLLATASDLGTLIRIFSTEDGTLLQEVRRGKDRADIKYICFDPNCRFLAATSNKGTVHIWSICEARDRLKKAPQDDSDEKNNNEEKVINNKTSIFKGLPSFLGGEFFKSEWSFAQVRITDHRSICAFSSEDTIIIVSTDGKYYKAKIDLVKGGECQILQEDYLLDNMQ